MLFCLCLVMVVMVEAEEAYRQLIGALGRSAGVCDTHPMAQSTNSLPHLPASADQRTPADVNRPTMSARPGSCLKHNKHS